MPIQPDNRQYQTVSGLFQGFLDDGLRLRVRVTGASMRPTLEDGDIVTLARAPATELKRGDLILFHNHERRLALHRILRKYPNADGGRRWQTRGDAQLTLDQPVAMESILGRVVRIEKRIGGETWKAIDLGHPVRRLQTMFITWWALAQSGFYYKLGAFIGPKAFR